jgi:hypothetical protein
LHDLQLVFTSGLESPGVVKNITVMICEDQFVLDIMEATLHKQNPHDQPSPTLKGRLTSIEESS